MYCWFGILQYDGMVSFFSYSFYYSSFYHFLIYKKSFSSSFYSMSAQIQYEVEYQKTVQGGGYSGEPAIAQPIHNK